MIILLPAGLQTLLAFYNADETKQKPCQKKYVD